MKASFDRGAGRSSFWEEGEQLTDVEAKRMVVVGRVVGGHWPWVILEGILAGVPVCTTDKFRVHLMQDGPEVGCLRLDVWWTGGGVPPVGFGLEVGVSPVGYLVDRRWGASGWVWTRGGDTSGWMFSRPEVGCLWLGLDRRSEGGEEEEDRRHPHLRLGVQRDWRGWSLRLEGVPLVPPL
ncbi:hypothetical protein Taro_026364 [Colocasia esculenta]|uniref:Uncharacterized protein n=1 Tax=Colocasia esculenta TaxID=4460 RepID=A0A843VKF1_COLES|nr:hypothetical protein [Colocasia esculenta]